MQITNNNINVSIAREQQSSDLYANFKLNADSRRLLEILTPKEIPVNENLRPIDARVHAITKPMLTTRINKLIVILQLNYAKEINAIVMRTGAKSLPINALVKARKTGVCSDAGYAHMIELYSLISYTLSIDCRVDSSVPYIELDYDSNCTEYST